MFAYFKGILSEKSPSSVVVECNGVGYDIKIPLSTFEALPEENEIVKLYIHVHYNQEDGNRLFGFFTQTEKDLFRMLISINRVGPRIGLSILSTLTASDIIYSIQNDNFKLLATAPGLGVKSAQKMIIELKDKINEIDLNSTLSTHDNTMDDIMLNEVEQALSTLGFKVYEINKALREIKFAKNSSTKDIIKQAIKYLYQKRNEA